MTTNNWQIPPGSSNSPFRYLSPFSSNSTSNTPEQLSPFSSASVRYEQPPLYPFRSLQETVNRNRDTAQISSRAQNLDTPEITGQSSAASESLSVIAEQPALSLDVSTPPLPNNSASTSSIVTNEAINENTVTVPSNSNRIEEDEEALRELRLLGKYLIYLFVYQPSN